MARGRLIEDPVFGYRLSPSRKGEVLRLEFWVDPGGGGKAEHYHPPLEERFEVLEGELTYRLNGRKHRAGPDDRFTVEPGTRHSFENSGSDVAHVKVEVEPALEMEQLFEDSAALAREGKWKVFGRWAVPTGPGALLDLAEFLDRYREIFVPTSPPRVLQRIGVPPLARLARRRETAPRD
jgi:quercetin dioxygenase-like cupin family protein